LKLGRQINCKGYTNVFEMNFFRRFAGTANMNMRLDYNYLW